MYDEMREIIDKSALDNTDMTDVRLLINHDENYILSRVTADNLTLTVDGIGLRFAAYPAETSYFKDLKINMEARNIEKCSFAFRLNKKNPDAYKYEFDENNKIYRVRIFDIAKISDVSIVTNPAYKQTECIISKRNLEKFKDELARIKQDEIRKRKIDIELALLKY